VANATYGSGISGSTAGISWTANATGGGVRVSAGLLYTSSASNALSFTFAPGVNGIAGNLYGTDSSSAAVPTTIMVTLSDGTIYFGNSNGPSDFIGFYSTGATISSLSVSPENFPSSSNPIYATANNLFFATVPAPGAVALIGLAGLVARRRERRS
jgi:MYXO-CTERM domain-containing protein